MAPLRRSLFYIDRTFPIRKNLRLSREKNEDYVPLWMNLEKCKDKQYYVYNTHFCIVVIIAHTDISFLNHRSLHVVVREDYEYVKQCRDHFCDHKYNKGGNYFSHNDTLLVLEVNSSANSDNVVRADHVTKGSTG